jgi:uncharacterized repeat protein (TIGR01451 family)
MTKHQFLWLTSATLTGLSLLAATWAALHGAATAATTAPLAAAADPGDVVINEVAWGGTGASSSDEWIELYNTTSQPITLTGWRLYSADGTPDITLSDSIPPHGYYLIERTADNTVSDIPANWCGSFGKGGLSNSGEVLTLTDEFDTAIDTANGNGGAWPCGSGSPNYYSMERIDPAAPDSDANWASNDGVTRNGLDADDQPINGTPKQRNSVYTAPPSPQPDLSLAKTGPVTRQPGQPITYTIRLSNTGQLTATAVRLTDTLPTAVTFITQTRPLTFTQNGGQLFWTIGDLPTGTAPLLITVTGRVSATAPGLIRNAVTATTSTTETLTANNRATCDTSIGGGASEATVLIAAVLADGYVPSTEDDEAVQIVNAGSAPVDLTDWRLDDSGGDTSYASFGPSLSAALDPGQSLWLAHSASDFYDSFGFRPDYETADTDPTVPDLDGYWPGYANGGDEVVLLDESGAIIDALIYGTGDPDEVGAAHWSGATLDYLDGARNNGQIFARKRDPTPGNSQNLLDTNTEADWIESESPGAPLYGHVNEGDIYGKRVMYPAWTSERFSRTLRVTTTARLTVGVAPDNIYDTIVAELEQAQESMYIEGYALTNVHFGRVITDLIAGRGLSVTVLLDTASYSENREKWICQKIEEAGGQVYLMHNLDETKRYRSQHSKFIILDERVVVIGSENYGYGAMPVDDKSDGTCGNRGAVLITDAEPVVEWALDIFRADANPERNDVARWGTRGFDPPPVGYTPPVTTGGGSGYSPLAPQPLTVEGEMFFEVIQSPETSLSFQEGLIGLLRRAGPGDTILVEMLDEDQHWGGASGNIADDPNPRLEAYIQAARDEATVRVLLDEEISVGGNRETVDYLNAIAVTETLDLQARAQNPTGAGIHNKMVLARIGGKGYVFVSSINGTLSSNRLNRELGLLVQSDAAYEYLKRIFDFDWEPTKRVYLPLIARNYVAPADHLLIGEIYYNPPNDPGQDETVEWIELYNPTGESIALSPYKLGDAAAATDPEGMYQFPAGATIGPGQVLVMALEATEFKAAYGFDPDFEFLHAGSTVPDMVEYPAWGTFRIGLRNAGDEVLLLDGQDNAVDAAAWGDSPYPCLPHPGVANADHSLERYPADRDTDDCTNDFRDWFAPSPGSVP